PPSGSGLYDPYFELRSINVSSSENLPSPGPLNQNDQQQIPKFSLIFRASESLDRLSIRPLCLRGIRLVWPHPRGIGPRSCPEVKLTIRPPAPSENLFANPTDNNAVARTFTK